MSEEQQVACRDTTFDGIKPEKIWLSYSNIKRKDYLILTLEINGVEKVLHEFYIPGLDRSEGLEIGSHNLTWILQKQL